MKLVEGGAARHRNNGDHHRPSNERGGAVRSAGTPGPRGSDPAAVAAAATKAAYDQLQDAEAAVRVAQSREAEIRAATPRLHPRLSAAVDAVDEAKDRDRQARQAVRDLDREVQDREGAVRVAQARVEDVKSATKPVSDAQRVGADEGLAKASRAVASARAEHEAAERSAERAAQQLAAAEERLQEVRGDRGPESSKVLAAVEAVRKAERERDRARERHSWAQREQRLVEQAAPVDAETGEPVQHFYDLEEFVVEYLLPNWEHRLDDKRYHWCAKWWAHPAAVTRLGHLWEAFEAARREPAPAMSSWWRDHVDHHMPWLTSEVGPFEMCSSREHEHKRQPLWGHDPAEDGMFPGNETAETEQVRQHALRSVLTQRQGSSDESHA